MLPDFTLIGGGVLLASCCSSSASPSIGGVVVVVVVVVMHPSRGSSIIGQQCFLWEEEEEESRIPFSLQRRIAAAIIIRVIVLGVLPVSTSRRSFCLIGGIAFSVDIRTEDWYQIINERFHDGARISGFMGNFVI